MINTVSELKAARLWIPSISKAPFNTDTLLIDSPFRSPKYTWDEAWDYVRAHTNLVNGVNIVVTPDLGLTVIDFDGSKGNREIQTAMLGLRVKFPATYAERSVSGAGVHMLLRMALPQVDGWPDLYRKLSRDSWGEHEAVEMFMERSVCWTGDLLDGATDGIAAADGDYVWTLLLWLLGVDAQRRTLGSSDLSKFERLTGAMDDDAVLALCRHSGGDAFQRLYNGTDGYNPSSGDLRFIRYLVYRTQDVEQVASIIRGSGRMRDKLKRDDYIQRTFERAIAGMDSVYDPEAVQRRRDNPVVEQHYDWQDAINWNQVDHDAAVRAKMVEAFKWAAEVRPGVMRAVSTIMGSGKSTLFAERLVDMHISFAWFAERHDMTDHVPVLRAIQHVYGCNKSNCPDYELHRMVAELGGNTGVVHSRHTVPCDYMEQATAPGSALYPIQLAGLPTVKDEHVIQVHDDIQLGNLLPKRMFTAAQIARAMGHPDVYGSTAAVRLLGAFQAAIGQAKDSKTTLTGKALWEFLLQHADTDSMALVYGFERKYQWLLNERPVYDVSDPRALADKPPSVVGPLAIALHCELEYWGAVQEGMMRDYASMLRVTGSGVTITQPRNLGELPSIFLDGTVDDKILQRATGMQVEVFPAEMPFPPQVIHAIIRDGARYSKAALKGDAFKAAVRKVQQVRRELGRTGSVGVITFSEREAEAAELLGASVSAHYFATRGNNDFMDVDDTMLIGVPRPDGEDILRLTAALYVGEDAIDPEYVPGRGYVDSRAQVVLDYIIGSELAQAAGRARTLRRNGAAVIAAVGREIPLIPATHIFQHFGGDPIAEAATRLGWPSKRPSIRALKAEAGIGQAAAQAWLDKNCAA